VPRENSTISCLSYIDTDAKMRRDSKTHTHTHTHTGAEGHLRAPPLCLLLRFQRSTQSKHEQFDWDFANGRSGGFRTSPTNTAVLRPITCKPFLHGPDEWVGWGHKLASTLRFYTHDQTKVCRIPDTKGSYSCAHSTPTTDSTQTLAFHSTKSLRDWALWCRVHRALQPFRSPGRRGDRPTKSARAAWAVQKTKSRQKKARNPPTPKHTNRQKRLQRKE